MKNCHFYLGATFNQQTEILYENSLEYLNYALSPKAFKLANQLVKLSATKVRGVQKMLTSGGKGTMTFRIELSKVVFSLMQQ